MPAGEELLHVTNGDIVVDSLQGTALGGVAHAWNDVLTEGPVPAVAEAELREIRARFLSDAGWGPAGAISSELERRDVVLVQALADQHVVLWFEHDLFDQLLLLQILALAAASDRAHLELIDVDSFAGREEFHGLGELDADELETLWPLRRPVTGEMLDTAVAAWDAFRASEPTALRDFLDTDSSELPFLAAALERLLEQLPAADTGLSRSERQLLEALSAGARTAAEAFLDSQRREAAPFDGDAWVWRRLAGLAAGARPLVVPAAGGALSPPQSQTFAATQLVLTEDGRAVLEGRADRVDLLGLNRWLGGTHLRPDNDWRWDPRARAVMRPPG